MKDVTVMRTEMISRLAEIALKEAQLLSEEEKKNTFPLEKTGSFIIERRHMADLSIGIPTSSICARVHSIYDAFPTHSHDFIELMYVCSGSVTHIIGDSRIELSEGDIILLGRSTKHAILATAESDIGVNVIISTDYFEGLLNELRGSSSLPEKFFEKLLSDDDTQYFVFRTREMLPVSNIMENLAYSLITGTITDSFIMQTSLTLLFSYLAATPELLLDNSNLNSYKERSKRMIVNYIMTSYKTATLSEAASMLGISGAHLCRWIKENFGVTFKTMLCEKRFEVAKDLLLTTNLPISDIILNVGYENSSYFHKEFSKRFGMTPMNYRRTYRKQ